MFLINFINLMISAKTIVSTYFARQNVCAVSTFDRNFEELVC